MYETVSPSSHMSMLIDIVDCSIVYFCLIEPVTLLTCMWTFERRLAASTSTLLNCLLPLVKGGMFTSAQWSPTVSSMVNPLSARIKSPGSNFCNKPEFSVKYTSDVLPPHP